MAKTKEATQGEAEDKGTAHQEGAGAAAGQQGPARRDRIVLVEDVMHVGKQGQVVEVKAGLRP